MREWLLDTISQTALTALALLSPVVFRSVLLDISNPDEEGRPAVRTRALQIADRLFYKPVATIVQMDYYPWTDVFADQIISADFAAFLRQEMAAQESGVLLFLPGIRSDQAKYESFEATRQRYAHLGSVISRRIKMADWQVDPMLIFASAWFKFQPDSGYSGYEPLNNRVNFIRIGNTYLAAIPLSCPPALASVIAEFCPGCGVISQVDGNVDSEINSQSNEGNELRQNRLFKVISETIQTLIERQLA